MIDCAGTISDPVPFYDICILLTAALRLSENIAAWCWLHIQIVHLALRRLAAGVGLGRHAASVNQVYFIIVR